MGQGAARITDIGVGTCAGHEPPEPYTTTFIEGSLDVLINGLGVVLVGNSGSATCGDPTTALTGSPSVLINGKPIHRFGDTGANLGPYTVVSSSVDVLIG